jgi:hypothetical protein
MVSVSLYPRQQGRLYCRLLCGMVTSLTIIQRPKFKNQICSSRHLKSHFEYCWSPWVCEIVEAFVTCRLISPKMPSVRNWQVSRSEKCHLDWGLSWFSPVISCNFRVSNLEHNAPSISMTRPLYTYRISFLRNSRTESSQVFFYLSFFTISLFLTLCIYPFPTLSFLLHLLFPSF